MILAEKEFGEYERSMKDRKHGMTNHLFLGHGPAQDTFEKRDFATTNDMMYDRRLRNEQVTDPNVFESDFGKTRSKQQINTQATDLPSMFGKGGTTSVPKSYNQFTGKFDNNSLKMGLRQ